MNTHPNHPADPASPNPAETTQPAPLNVWLCASDPAHASETRCPRHTATVTRRLADQLVEHLSRPGGIVAATGTAATVLAAGATQSRRRPVTIPSAEVTVSWPPTQAPSDPASDRSGRAESQVARTGDDVPTAPPVHGVDLLVTTASHLSAPSHSAPSHGRTPGGPDTGTALDFAVRVLRPGGVLAVLVPTAKAAIIGGLIDAAGTHGLAYTQHIIAIQAPVTGGRFVIATHPGCVGCLTEQMSPREPVSVHVSVLVFTRLRTTGERACL